MTRWLHHQTERQSKRVRRIMIAALAGKLAIALWRYVELGLIPHIPKAQQQQPIPYKIRW